MSPILRHLRLATLRTPALRRYSTEPPQPQYQAPSAEPKKPNPHAELYRNNGTGRAIAWNFLVAMATFQVLYWGWLKLESMEVKREKGKEIEGLEEKVKELVARK